MTPLIIARKQRFGELKALAERATVAINVPKYRNQCTFGAGRYGTDVATDIGLRPHPCRSGRRRTSVGHQNHGPRMRRMLGTTNERTISVSSSRPIHTVEPT